MISYLDSTGFEKLLPQSFLNKSFQFDLSGLKFVKPQGIVEFLLLIFHLNSLGKKITIIAPHNTQVLDYLHKIRFYNEVKEIVEFTNLHDKYLTEEGCPTSTMQALTRVKTHDDVRPVVDKFARYLSDELMFNEDIVNELWSVMVELIENIPHHAYPTNEKFPIDEGFVNIQYLPNMKKIYFSVGDLGIGIKESVNRAKYYTLTFKSDSSVLKTVMTSGISSKGGIRGGGIYVTSEKVKQFNGWIMIRSHTGYAVQDPRGNIKTLDGLNYLPGTQVSIHISPISI
jgi:hypothetical protein